MFVLGRQIGTIGEVAHEIFGGSPTPTRVHGITNAGRHDMANLCIAAQKARNRRIANSRFLADKQDITLEPLLMSQEQNLKG
jgi:hypothetical protein